MSYKFNTIKKHWIPMVSIGTVYTIYSPPSFRQDVFPQNVFERRLSGSTPVDRTILSLDYPDFDFSDKSQVAPFATIGLIYALSNHSFVRFNGKFATQQNTGNAILRSKSYDLIKQSTIKTRQLGAFVEYFIIF